MKDNFDLKKFLTENKTFENFNPYTSKKEPLNENTLRERIREMILAELSDKELEDATVRAEKGDSTDLALHMAGIKENDPYDIDPEEEAYGGYEEEEDYKKYFPTFQGLEDEPMSDLDEAKKKKDEEEAPEEEVDVEATAEEVPAEEAPAEEAPAADGGGLEDIAADMEGTEGDLMNHLMGALKIAKGMNNEKLETQVGNTLKFFVSQYIGGGND